jgi:hypothetical protein
MSSEFDYDNENWSKFFYVDPTSKSGLRWNISVYSLGGNKQETWPGKEAGILRPVKNKDNKAWCVTVKLDGQEKSKPFAAHRVIAVLSGMKVNGKVIDHINGISADNRVENLRVTDQAVNSRNCKVQDNSPYGITGVGFQEDKKGNAYFIARWMNGDKRCQESFPIKRLGVMEAFQQAVICRKKNIRLLNEQGAGYTERHTHTDESYVDLDTYKVSKEDYAKSFRNSKKRINNSSGVTGVCFQHKVGEGTRAMALWKEGDKQCSKSFSVKIYGLLESFALACAYREQKIKELNDLGYGYTENHGK